jgi:uncharacterized protein (PEP-CTERM system associated)
MSGSSKPAGFIAAAKMTQRLARLRVHSCCAFLTLFTASPGWAGDWQRFEAITGAVTAVDRTGDNAQSGVVLQASPQFGLTGQGGRSTADINYRLTASLGLGSTDPRPLAHNLVARGEVEAVEDFFFLGATAGARLGGTSSLAGPVDAINFNADGGSQSFSLGLQPRFVAHLNRYVDLVSDNRFDLVAYTSDSERSDDSRSGRLHVGARSGRYFGPWSWRADLSEQTTRYDSRDDETRSYARLTASYPIDTHFLLSGSVGYEDNDVRTNRAVTSGSTWDVGVRWKPNPRTDLNGVYGSRYFGEFWKVSAQHRSRRTAITLSTSRDVDNRRNEALVDSNLFLLDDQGFIVTDPNSGDPIRAETPGLESTEEDFVNTRIRGILRVTGKRTTFLVSGEVSNRDYEVSEIDEDSYRVRVEANRVIGQRLGVTLAGDYEDIARQDGIDSSIYSVGLSLTRQVGRECSVALNLGHRERTTDVEGAGYTENRIGVSLTTSFF